MKTYRVNDVFCSLQGEGAFAGSRAVFVRFSACNLECSATGEAGFDCDTEFASGERLTLPQIAQRVRSLWPTAPRVILTGGEPMLQLDDFFVEHAIAEGWRLAVETNGTVPAPASAIERDVWLSVSPKTAEHTIRVQRANELRYVRTAQHAIPQPRIECRLRYLSPAWSDDPKARRANLEKCIALVHENPDWQLSLQMHKLWRVQ